MKLYFKTSLAMSIITYLIVSFVRWDITWIKYVGTYEPATRMWIVYAYICMQFLNVGITSILKNVLDEAI